MRNELCKLIARYSEEEVISQKETEVFCRKKSAVRSEFYAAYAVGLHPRIVLEIDPMDWEYAAGPDGAPTMVSYHGKLYNIYRDYQTDESTMELTVG